MAKKDNVRELRQKSRFAAMEGLRPKGALPKPPRKAMKDARKTSKRLSYPVPPYPGANPVQVYRWAQEEWWRLGRWQKVALPAIILTALLTWERENELRQARWDEVERADTKQLAAETYGAFGRPAPRRKLLGIIPLPSRK